MSKTNKVIISCCLCGAGTTKAQAPTVPLTPEEIARQIVDVTKAGAAVVHIHVREDKVVDGELKVNYKSMSLEKFTETVELARKYCAEAGVDPVINLTTSGGEYEDFKRLQHLEALKPEDNHIVRMWRECGLDVGSAGDSQALIQLKKEYCDRKECLRCRFGYEFLTGEHRHRFLSEPAKI